jgi:hypothetical protein
MFCPFLEDQNYTFNPSYFPGSGHYRYMDRMRRRELRRERLHIFLTTEIKTTEPIFISRENLRTKYHKEWLRLKNSYREYGHVIQTAFGSDIVVDAHTLKRKFGEKKRPDMSGVNVAH